MNDIYTKFHYDELQDRIVTERVQDCTAIADATTRLRNEGLHENRVLGTHVATLPKVMVEKYCNDNAITLHEFMCNDEHINRMVNDPALAYFRVYPNRIEL